MNLQDIKIIEINEYTFQFQLKKDCTVSDLLDCFHISRKKWNQNTFRNNKSIKEPYLKDSICTIDFFQEELKERIEKPIQVLYEDLYIIAIYKPPFLLVHDDGNQKDNLQNRINQYLFEQGWPYQSQAIHRIDFETSGIVLFSKFPFFQGLLDSLLESHDVIKEYYALVQGMVPFQKKTVKASISRNRHNAKAMMVNKNGKRAISHIEVISKKANCTLCKVRIETGRKHQIRVHFSSIGYPIINDSLYGTVLDSRGLLLENAHMEFNHPITLKRVNIQIPLDKRFNIK